MFPVKLIIFYELTKVLTKLFVYLAADLMSSKSSPNTSPTNSASTPSLSKYALWIEPRDVWCIKLDPIWIDFLGARSVGQNKSVPFVDAVPITFWIHGRSSEKFKVNSRSKLSIKIFVFHLQYSFLKYFTGR